MHFSLASIALAALASTASAANFTVQVGASSQLAFSPTNVTAAVGDTISFVFNPKNHTVTQSTFTAPCQPMSGGVDSGFQAVAAGATNVPSFTITVNATTPLWFFCHQTGYCAPLSTHSRMLTICDIVTVSRVWSSPSTQQRTSPSRLSRLRPRRHPLTVPLPALPTRLARGHQVPVPGRRQAAPPRLPRHQNPMARLLLVHVQVAFSQWLASSPVSYSRLFPFAYSVLCDTFLFLCILSVVFQRGCCP
jgi:plastocyanin